jgi:DNA-binding IclR family transcriptional regulator
VAKLVAAHIDSVEKLEILLLLRGESETLWTAEQVSRELRRNATSASRCLAQLADGRLLERPDDERYRFAPADAAVAKQVDRLAETYATRRVAVVQLIVSNPMDSVTTFADAFRFRRKD